MTASLAVPEEDARRGGAVRAAGAERSRESAGEHGHWGPVSISRPP